MTETPDALTEMLEAATVAKEKAEALNAQQAHVFRPWIADALADLRKCLEPTDPLGPLRPAITANMHNMSLQLEQMLSMCDQTIMQAGGTPMQQASAHPLPPAPVEA